MNLDLVRSRGAAIAAAAVCLTLGVAACGDDDSTDSTDSAEASTTTEASAETVEFVNDGKESHALVFAKLNEGFTVEEAVQLEGKKGSAVEIGTTGADPGKTGTLTVKEPIEPGDYVMLCPISGPEGPHYKLGQLEEFAIE